MIFLGIGAAIIRTDEFNNLVKGGVPDSFRGYIWKLNSGAINRALVAPESYHVLKERYYNQHSTHTEAIDRVRTISVAYDLVTYIVL